MANAFNFTLEGGTELLRKLKNLPTDIQKRIDAEIEDSARNIEGKAIRRAAANFGGSSGLRSGIIANRDKPMTWTVYSSKDYSAYIEFGTGGLVDVPAGLETYAMQFKGKGIKQVNLPARPFFFNSYFEERPKLIAEIKKILKDV